MSAGPNEPLVLSPAEDPEEVYEQFVWNNLKRNYLAHYLHGMLGMTGFRIMSAPTFLPAYIFQLSGSSAMVGLAQSLQQIGMMLSPVVGANLVEHKKRVLPSAMMMGFGMRVPILFMAFAGWALHGQALLWTMMGLLLVLGFFQGAQRVVFQLLLAKVIPVTLRGRLQAFRNITGGIVAAVLSYMAGRYLIQHDVLGNGYATTFLIVFLLTSSGLWALSRLMREPEPPSLRERTRLRDRIKDFRGLIAGDHDYRNFLIAQGMTVAARSAAPFYILHAGHTVQMTGAAIGLFSLAFLGADTASNMLWGYFGDRSGFRSNYIVSLLIGAASACVLIFAHSTPMFLVAFAGLGIASGGYILASQTLILEFGHRNDMAMRVAISATMEGAIAAIGPALLGLLAAVAGYIPVFAIAVGLQAVAMIVLIMGVREPRHRTATPS